MTQDHTYLIVSIQDTYKSTVMPSCKRAQLYLQEFDYKIMRTYLLKCYQL